MLEQRAKPFRWTENVMVTQQFHARVLCHQFIVQGLASDSSQFATQDANVATNPFMVEIGSELLWGNLSQDLKKQRQLRFQQIKRPETAAGFDHALSFRQ
jgi:hypothetical protein